MVLGLCVLDWSVMTLLLFPLGSSWLQNELAPSPLSALSWAEQVGSGAERPWENRPGPTGPSPQPPAWVALTRAWCLLSSWDVYSSP